MDVCTGIETQRQCAQKSVKQSGGALYGTVVEVTADQSGTNQSGADAWYYVAKFKVERSWKYRTAEFVYVRSYTDNGANCGVTLELGKSYLLFTRTDAGQRAFVSGCDVGPTSYAEYLGRGKKPYSKKSE